MPQRTNEKQQVIEMLKKLLAPQGCTVTRSKMLLDRELNVEREVDVVAEMTVDGHLFTQSFEIVGRGHPMGITWVDGVIKKHATLPTDRLYLVSWSGFTEAALKRAQGTAKVFPVTVDPAPGAASLYADQIHVALKRIVPVVKLPDGRQFGIQFVPDLGIFSSDGELLGTVWQLGSWIIQRPLLGRTLLEQLRAHADRESISRFQLELPLDAAPFDNLYVRFERTDVHNQQELQHIVGAKLVGEVRFEQQRVDLSLKNSEVAMFGHGEVMLGGVRHLIIASLEADADVKGVFVEPHKSPDQKDPVITGVDEDSDKERPIVESPAEEIASSGLEHKLPRLNVVYAKRLGDGAFGTVWEATDPLLERKVAVKFLTSTAEAFDEDALLRNARTLAKLNHPNLVTAHSAALLRHPENGLLAPALIMELLSGASLQQWSDIQRDREQSL